MNIKHVGEGKVVLLAGGGKIFTDIAARFVGTEKSLDEIVASPYDKKIVDNIINSGHGAATEFDYFVFGIEGYARVTEIQLVRKRLASYLIKSGRKDKSGKRSFDVAVPGDIMDFFCQPEFPARNIVLPGGKLLSDHLSIENVKLQIDAEDLLNLTEYWYNTGVDLGRPEENLRYMKQQATEFKAIIGMNAHGLLDWFKIRTCKNAQTEIRDLATKMMSLCKEAAPDLFQNAGPSCKALGYCPEEKLQHKDCKGKVYTRQEAMGILKHYRATEV